MIEKKRHWERYSALMDKVTGGDAQSARRRDGGYKAALYILAADDDLYRLATEAVDEEGVAFGDIVSRLKKECYSESQLTALLAARGLFSGRDFGVGPMDMVSCEWSMMDVPKGPPVQRCRKRTWCGEERYGGMCANVGLTGQGGGDEAGRYPILPGVRPGIHIPRWKTQPTVPAVLPESVEEAKAGGAGEIEVSKSRKRRAAYKRAAASAWRRSGRLAREGCHAAGLCGASTRGETGRGQKGAARHHGGADEGPCGQDGT